jgi:hypothetical protein
MRLTNHMTVINLSRRREAVGDWSKLQDFFKVYWNRPVKFKDETGELQKGVLVDLLRDGTFVIRTEDGQEHEVEHNQIMHALI